MVERIFAEQTLTACFIESDQTRDHLARRHGLRECDRLLIDNVACPGLNGNVRQPELFDAALIADAQIDAFCPAQVRGQTPDENVVFGGHGALDAASGRRGVFTDAQALFRGTLQKCVAHNHSQGALARDLADSFGKRDHFAEPRPALVAVEQMLLDGFFFRVCQRRQPIVREDCRVDGI